MVEHQFDLVLPCYNPPVGWEEGVISHYDKVRTRHPNSSFLLHIVNDGAIRGYEPEVKARLQEAIPSVDFVLYEQNRGKGYALRQAVSRCNRDYIIYVDYDFPYTDDSFDRVIRELLSGADVVVAVRGKSYQLAQPFFRRFLSISSHLINRFLFGLKITDTQGGLKGFNRVGRDIFLTTTIDTFLFDTQFIRKSSLKPNISISAVETETRGDIKFSNMGLSVMFREATNLLKILRE